MTSSSSARLIETMQRKREKQSQQAEFWTRNQHYYEHWSRKNTKFNDWTSPRYHAQQQERIDQFKAHRDRTENLEKRRQLLRQLLHQDEQNEKYELMLLRKPKTKKQTCNQNNRANVCPTEVLKELNIGLKVDEEDRRRHRAELGLYQQWRNSNPVLKHYERMYRGRELKLSWLDQQIELRMRKEQQEEECKRMLAEYKKRELDEIERERREREEIETKRGILRKDLEIQIEQLEKKTLESQKLKMCEEKEMLRLNELKCLENERVEKERKRNQYECALFNIKQYKMKLRKKHELVKSELEEQREYVEKLRASEMCERIANETKRKELKRSLDEFLVLVRDQKELERVRERHFQFLFDSETKAQYEKQSEQWAREEQARSELVASVLRQVQQQIEENVRSVREQARKVVGEREEMLKQIEEYNAEMKTLQLGERERKKGVAKELRREIEEKKKEKSEVEVIGDELEEVRKEEERIKREILEMQRRQGPIRPGPSRIFF